MALNASDDGSGTASIELRCTSVVCKQVCKYKTFITINILQNYIKTMIKKISLLDHHEQSKVDCGYLTLPVGRRTNSNRLAKPASEAVVEYNHKPL